MKPEADAGMLTLIRTQAQFSFAELFTFTMRSGTQDRFTDLDFNIVYNLQTYKANSIRIEGLRSKLAVGWQVDEQEVKISAYPGETLAGADFFAALESGLLDGAYIQRSRGFWAAGDGPAYEDFAADPIAVIPIFTGRVSTIDKIGRTHAQIRVKSPLSLLDIDMPRNTYQAGCQWLLYGPGCGLDRADFTTSFTVVSADHRNITVASIGTPTGADGLASYLQGRLLFTSGDNNGLQTIIATNTSTVFTLQYPLLTVPAPGDTFDASWGCSKGVESCDLKFNNKLNFRGFPRVPPVVVSF